MRKERIFYIYDIEYEYSMAHRGLKCIYVKINLNTMEAREIQTIFLSTYSTNSQRTPMTKLNESHSFIFHDIKRGNLYDSIIVNLLTGTTKDITLAESNDKLYIVPDLKITWTDKINFCFERNSMTRKLVFHMMCIYHRLFISNEKEEKELFVPITAWLNIISYAVIAQYYQLQVGQY